MEPNGQNQDVLDALRDIQKTQSILLNAVGSLPGKIASDTNGASDSGTTLLITEKEPETAEATLADSAIKATGSQTTLSSSPITSTGTSRIILT